MPKAVKEMLQNGFSVDETDKTPENTNVSNYDIIMYIVAIVGHFVDLGVDINIAVRYFLAKRMVEFGWTLAFILFPAFVNTAVSIRMYSQDTSQRDSLSDQFTKRRGLRIFMLVFLMAPILRLTDALIYALKARRAQRLNDNSTQRLYYRLMLKEDADASLLRIFECFLEAAPQQVLQMCLLFKLEEEFTVHQILSILSSIIGMGWCLAAYQRAIRFAQEDKGNMNWMGTLLQILWHFLVTFSRITGIAAVAFLYPYWTMLACGVHILVMATWLQLIDRTPFCSHNILGQIAFSVVMAMVYLFTYILPIEGRTRYRYAVYYTICFMENLTITLIWFFFSDYSTRWSMYFYPVLFLITLPYVVGIVFMIVYYSYFHPKVRKGNQNITISFKSAEQIEQFVS